MRTLPERWTPEQVAHYLRVYRYMSANAAAFWHPKAPVITPENWETICHNAAWVAAELVDDVDLSIVDSETKELLAQSPSRGLNS